MALDDAGYDIGDVALRVDAVQLAGLDERGEHGPVLAAAFGAGEIAARSLAQRYSDVGQPTEIEVFLRDGSLAGRYVSVPDLGRLILA